MVEKHNKNQITIEKSRVRSVALTGFLMCALFVVFFYDLTVRSEYAYTPVDAVIPFECINSTGMENASFVIKIKSEDTAAPVPDRDTITLDNSGKGEFKIKITEPGTFVYRVYQEKGTDPNIDYDESQYDIHVCVMNDENGKLMYTISVNYADSDVKPEEITFKNADTDAPTDTSTDTPTETTTKTTTETTTGTTTEGKKDGGTPSHKTGDNIGLLFVIFCISFIGIVVLLSAKRISGKGGQYENEDE